MAIKAPLASDQRPFAELLHWHLNNGTRPSGGPDVPGRPWTMSEFAQALRGEELVSPRTVNNWVRGSNLPAKMALEPIERALFGDVGGYADWRRQLREAYNASSEAKRRGTIVRPPELARESDESGLEQTSSMDIEQIASKLSAPYGERSVWAADGGIYLGFAVGRDEIEPDLTRSRELRYTGEGHLLTIGPSGSGKSRRLLVPNLEKLASWSIIVTDPNGELARATAEHRGQQGSRIVMLDPFGIRGTGRSGYDPIAALDPNDDDFADDALDFAVAIVTEDTPDGYWRHSAEDLLAAVIMFVRLTCDKGGSLADVRKVIVKPPGEFKSAIDHMISVADDLGCVALQLKAGRFQNFGVEDRELNSIISTAATATRWIDSKVFLSKPQNQADFEFSSLREEKSTVYLILPSGQVASHSAWLRLMITSAVKSLTKTYNKRDDIIPVLFALDEAAQLGHLAILENSMALMRGFDLKVWSLFQDLAQIRSIYRDRWETLLANCSVITIFPPRDVFTAEYVCQRAGGTVQLVHSHVREPNSMLSVDDGSRGLNRVSAPVLRPQDLWAMAAGSGFLFGDRLTNPVRYYAPSA